MERGITVAEVTYCNSISVAEHVVMMILGLVRNYIPSYQWVVKGGWNIADCVARSYDVEGMNVGTVAAGPHRPRGAAPAEALRHEAALHRPPPPAGERREGARPDLPQVGRRHGAASATWSRSTRRSIPETENLFNAQMIAQDEARRLSRQHRPRQDRQPRRGRRGAGERPARRLRRRRLVPAAGAAGPPWRTMPHHGMTPHISGTSLSAQARYAAGTREILECWFERRPIRDEYLIVDRRQARRRRRPFLQRRQRHRRLGGGGEVQEDNADLHGR